MSVEQAFTAALARTREQPGPDLDQATLLPGQLAEAAVAVLGVPGCGLSLVADDPLRRFPLGSSSPEAALAESLQFTAGEGPCLTAHRIGQPVFATAEDMQLRWPVFADLLATRTSYRAIGSFPLQAGGRRFGALDVYLRDQAALPGLDALEVSLVAGLVSDGLTAALDDPDAAAALEGVDEQAELSRPATDRLRVWQAVGMVAADAGLAQKTALDRLRGFAYAAGITVDDLATHLVLRHIDPVAITDGD